jgi:hypothetical protein
MAKAENNCDQNSISNRTETKRGDEEFLSATQAAAMLCIHPETLRQRAAQGKIEAVSTPGGKRRYKASVIAKEILKQQGQINQQDPFVTEEIAAGIGNEPPVKAASFPIQVKTEWITSAEYLQEVEFVAKDKEINLENIQAVVQNKLEEADDNLWRFANNLGLEFSTQIGVGGEVLRCSDTGSEFINSDQELYRIMLIGSKLIEMKTIFGDDRPRYAQEIIERQEEGYLDDQDVIQLAEASGVFAEPQIVVQKITKEYVVKQVENFEAMLAKTSVKHY